MIQIRKTPKSTEEQVSEANFRNVAKVMGTDSVTYVLIFGGLKKKRIARLRIQAEQIGSDSTENPVVLTSANIKGSPTEGPTALQGPEDADPGEV